VDQFGQIVETEGNYKVTVNSVSAGQGQVLKSNIFTHIDDFGLQGETASKMSKLRYISNFVDDNGNFMLDAPQTLTVSFEGGGSASFTVYGNDSLNDLGLKMQEAIYAASGMIPVTGSPVQFVGRDMDARSIEYTYKLASSWLENSASRIEQYYGLVGTGGKLSLTAYNKTPDDWPAMRAAASYVTGDGNITANLDEFNPYTDFYEPWDNAINDTFDMTISHELTHAVTFSHEGISKAMMEQSGWWLAEGLADYIPGTNSRASSVLANAGSDAQYLLDIKAIIQNVFDHTNYDTLYSLSYGSNERIVYPASYLAVRYLDQKGEDGMGWDGMGKTIASLLKELDSTGGTAAALDEAIKNASGLIFDDRADFLAQLLADDAYLLSVAHEDSGFDTGAVGGYYATGGKQAPLDPERVIGDSDGFKINPLERYGWSGIDWYGELDIARYRNEYILNEPPNNPSAPGEWQGILVPSVGALSASLPKSSTLQSVNGTLLLHSPVSGTVGKMTISGDEKLVQALGFAEIREAVDAVYNVTIADAHDGKIIVSGAKMSGNTIVGALHGNISITLPPNFALGVDGNDTLPRGYGSYKFRNGTEDFILHIASNATILQTGANEGEFFIVNFGDAGSKALGLNGLQMTSHETASRAIKVLDNAIGIVSYMRARLGAYQNRLEHTIVNLATLKTNVTDTESRIRDADMAKETLEFTKLNILSQASTSMMAQANQIPQGILALLRNTGM
jgi:flagellin-like hook-associated protein FlgL